MVPFTGIRSSDGSAWQVCVVAVAVLLPGPATRMTPAVTGPPAAPPDELETAEAEEEAEGVAEEKAVLALLAVVPPVCCPVV